MVNGECLGDLGAPHVKGSVSLMMNEGTRIDTICEERDAFPLTGAPDPADATGRSGAPRPTSLTDPVPSPARPPRRHRGVALACAALALLGLLAHPSPAAAQVVTTFISNTGQTTTFTSDLVQAVAFTTGTSTYDLSSIGIYLGSQTDGEFGPPFPQVNIYEDNGGNPGNAIVIHMIFPGSIKENEVNSFTPRPVGTSIGDEPPSLTLKPGTTYWVVTSNVAEFNGTGLNVGLTNRSLDTGTSVGWSLGNARSKENYDDVLWTDSSPLRFEIRGTGGTPATGAPTITGTAEVGQTLTADTAAIMDGDGLNNVNYMYQWIRGATEIDEATASTYTLVAADQGMTIKVKVSFTDNAGYAEARTSAATETVVAAPNTPATGAPTIMGTAQVGQMLTATVDDIEDVDGLPDPFLTDANTSFQWIQVDGDTEMIISEATETLTLLAADEGKTFKVTVSFTDKAGYPEERTSEATATVRAANTLATGRPSITGTTQVGQMLTATVGDIADGDGLPDSFLTVATTTFQWIRVAADATAEAPIPEATASTYTLVAADQDTMIKVTVSFTDDASNVETLTSATTPTIGAPPPNTPATGAPTITGTAQVGEILTAETAAIMDTDGLTSVTYTYQWIRVDTGDETDIGAMTSTYTLVEADEGMTIKVRVNFTDDAGNAEARTSAATAIVTAADNTPATGAPTITGTAQVGEILTAETAAIMDTDGLTSVTYTYQWIRVDTGDETDIGAMTSTYTLVEADEGMTIKVRVNFTDDAGNAEARTSAATAIVTAADNTPATGAPTITGTAQVGEILTAETAAIMDTDGLTSVTYTYQWIRVDTGDETDIGAMTSTYTLVEADEGMTIKVRVNFTDDAGNAEARTSAATAIVTAADNTPATGAPTITGTAQVGEILTAETAAIMDTDGLTSVTYTYQWIRVDTGDETDIGAMTSTYTLVEADEGMTIKVRVNFTDDAGNAEARTSAATAIVTAADNTPATGAPTITGTAQVGQMLTADTTAIMDDDGLDNAIYMYQWSRVAPDNTETNISEPTTTNTYTLVTADQGATIKVTVSFTDDLNNAERLTSAATETVEATANTLATGAPTITGTAQVGQTLTAGTTAIMDDNGLDNAIYMYQWIRVATDNIETNISEPTTTNTYTLVAADQGTTIKVRVSFTDNAGYAEALTSAATETVTAVPNTPATGLPTITGTAQVGQTLTADTTAIMDDNGLDNAIYMYQWIRVATDNTETNISEPTTTNTYTLVTADQGTTIKVTVSFTDDLNNPETLTSTATATVTAAVSTPATGAPTITGTAEVGQTLTAATTAIMDANGLINVRYTYQWIRVATDNIEAPISEATANTYTLVTADQGKTIKVTVSFTDDASNAEALNSEATTAVEATANNFATGAPTITGTAQVGQTLTAGITAIRDANGLPGDNYTYQWIRVDDNTETDISGATASTYTLVAADQGKTIKVTVSFTDNAGYAETLTSAATAAARVVMVAPSTVRAWTSRFGRTVATHVTDAVGERLRQSPGEDSQVTVGGYRLPLGRHAAGGADPDATEPETTTDRLASLLTGLVGRVLGLAAPQGGDGTDPRVDEPDPRLGQSQPLQLPTIRLRDVLLGSSFRLALGDDDAAPGDLRLTAWGRVAGTQFSGRDGALTLDGNVLTGTVGVDSAWDRWLTGVAVSHSLGGGSFTGDRAGDFDSSTLTSLHPYLRYAFNERVDVWSVLGYGWGDMTLEPGTGGTLETDTTLLMGAFGGRGILLSAPDNAGFQLATRTDAMLTRMTSGAVAGLAATDAEAHRLRLVLEGTREVTWPEGQRVTPTVELGVRHDWGDAETGFGLELGGRVQYADPSHGLTIEVAVRGLLAHEDSDYKEWGASGTIRIDPGPTGQGLSLTLAPTWGAASSGIESLWARQTTAGLAPQGTRSAPTGRLNAEVSYGVAAPFGTGLLTPYVGTVLTDGAARTYRVGTRLELTGGWTTGVTLSLEGQRQEPVGPQPIYQGLQFQAAWGF